jgi:CubicO group peptidase (beta-lactamase class C family)
MQMTTTKPVRWLTAGLALLALSLRLAYPPLHTRAAVGVNKLNPAVSGNIDTVVKAYLGTTANKCTQLTLGIVFAGDLVLTKSYAAPGFTADSLTATHQWASISKPLTALIAFRLLDRWEISLNTAAWDYDPSYLNKIPLQYQNPALNIKYLLTFTGGVRDNGPLIFIDSPANQYRYSTCSTGILGTDLLPAIQAPDAYPTLVENEIASPSGLLA